MFTWRVLQIFLSELSNHLAKVNGLEPTDYQRLGEKLVESSTQATERLSPKSRGEPAVKIVPKIGLFVGERLLGAGAFGSVYKAKFKPGTLVSFAILTSVVVALTMLYICAADMVCTVKLVCEENFRVMEHAVVDRVVASVVQHPFVVEYYTCFCVQDRITVTVMEYLKGLDLQKGLFQN